MPQTSRNLSLQDKIIVITGASSGAGRAAALEFARYQTFLVLVARNQTALEEVAAECRELGGRRFGGAYRHQRSQSHDLFGQCSQ